VTETSTRVEKKDLPVKGGNKGGELAGKANAKRTEKVYKHRSSEDNSKGKTRERRGIEKLASDLMVVSRTTLDFKVQHFKGVIKHPVIRALTKVTLGGGGRENWVVGAVPNR